MILPEATSSENQPEPGGQTLGKRFIAHCVCLGKRFIAHCVCLGKPIIAHRVCLGRPPLGRSGL